MHSICHKYVIKDVFIPLITYLYCLQVYVAFAYPLSHIEPLLGYFEPRSNSLSAVL